MTTRSIVHRAHPWHGVSLGPRSPKVVVTYVEIVPMDTVKYEIDKESGILMIDRPQRYSNACPTIYGFLPRTYSGDRVARITAETSGRKSLKGDGDPIDVCVLAERPITHGDILLQARPVGGLQLIDKGEADDKIVAVLDGDPAYGEVSDIRECPEALIERIKHYFLTYKLAPGSKENHCELAAVYGPAHAERVIDAGIKDYDDLFPAG